MTRLNCVAVVASVLAVLLFQRPSTEVDLEAPFGVPSRLMAAPAATARTWAEADGVEFVVCPPCEGECVCGASGGWTRPTPEALLVAGDSHHAVCADQGEAVLYEWVSGECRRGALPGFRVEGDHLWNDAERYALVPGGDRGLDMSARRYRRAARAQWRSATQDPDLTLDARWTLAVTAGESLVLSWVTDTLPGTRSAFRQNWK